MNRPYVALTPQQVLEVRPDGLSFIQCLMTAADSPELVNEFDRLYGTNLTRKGSGFELAIDKATGRMDSDLEQFAAFVHDIVFTRIPLEKPAGASS